MSDGLSPAAVLPAAPEPARPRPTTREIVVQALLVVVTFVVAGAVSGVVWWWAWTPPTGAVADEHWYPGEPGLRQEFGGTGWYVVIALLGGLLLGVICAWRCDRSEIATLIAVVVGSVLAAIVMREVGQRLGPADPIALARTTSRRSLPGDLRLGGWSAAATLPLGALLGLCGVYLLTVGRNRR